MATRSMERPEKTREMKAVEAAALAAHELKGKDILVLHMEKIGYTVTDYFVIVTAFTKEHMQAIADKIEQKVYEEAQIPLNHIEGYEGGWWILMDFVDFVVHIMSEEAREYYMLEDLWSDAPTWRFPDDFYASASSGNAEEEA